MSENKLWLKMSFGQKIQKTHNMHTREYVAYSAEHYHKKNSCKISA